MEDFRLRFHLATLSGAPELDRSTNEDVPCLKAPGATSTINRDLDRLSKIGGSFWGCELCPDSECPPWRKYIQIPNEVDAKSSTSNGAHAAAGQLQYSSAIVQY